MANDEELARHVAQAEGGSDAAAVDAAVASEALEEYRSVASDVHDELARRIDAVDDRKPDREALVDIVDRLERLEARIDDLESRL